ncbi:MAG TPA: hypothetical protein VHV08_04665 [Pirellulales bacterium]|nr:hypothetical protein [Pirellulales bacterium]
MIRRLTTIRLLVSAACLLAVLAMTATAEACPSCKQALNGDGSQGELARGLYYSILFMMSMPFAIVGTFGCMAYRAVKKGQLRKTQQQERCVVDADPAEIDRVDF